MGSAAEYLPHVIFFWILAGVFVVGFTYYAIFFWPECKKEARDIRQTYEELLMVRGEVETIAIVFSFTVVIVLAWPWLLIPENE